MGALLGIFLGQNYNSKKVFSEIIFLIVLLIFIKRQPNAGVALFFRKLAERKCPTPMRFGGLQKIIKKYYRYIKCLFNKKVVITFIISATIFNIYSMILNNKYEKFYRAVGEEAHLEAVIISRAKESEYYNSYTVKG